MKPKVYVSFLRLAMCTLLVMITSAYAYSQRTATGTVTDEETGEPLIYANVAVVGTTVGATTDFDGKYSIDLPEGGTQLEFSYTGYQSKTIDVGDGGTFDVTLLAGEALQEVVVIGYGAVKKDDVTGSVTQISEDEFNAGQIASPEQLVTGKVAGVQITSGGGAPGGGSQIRIRSGSSLNASNDPLIIVDGIPLDNSGVSGSANALSSINPNDIESFTVLKDASATAIYGSRASNGVIIITTKKGTSGKLKFNYNGNASFGQLINQVETLTGDQFRQVVTGLGRKTELLGTENTDWQDAIFQSASATDQNLGISGSIADALPFRISLGYNNQTGLLKTSSYERLSGALALNPSFLKDHLKVNLRYRTAIENNVFANQGAIGAAISMDPTQPIYTDNTIYGGYFEWLDQQGNPQAVGAVRNPLALLELTENTSTVKRNILGAQFDYRFHFLPELRANLNLGLDKSNSEGAVYSPIYAANNYNPDEGASGGQDNIFDQDKENRLLEFYLNYNNDLESINSNLDATAGYSYQSFRNEGTNRNQEINGANLTVGDFASENVLISFFGRAVYTLANKYSLTGTLRADGSSRFNEDNRWGIFPSVAFAWNVGREDFLKDSKTLSDLKFRLSWGVTGQQDVQGQDYPYLPTYVASNEQALYPLGDTYYTTFRPSGYDANIKWEETTTINAGLDYGFVNNRIYGSLDVYKRTTEDLLNVVPIPAGSNLTNLLLTNVGSMENTGLEFAINAVAIDKKDIGLDLGFNITFATNEITKLTINEAEDFIGVATGGINGATGLTAQIHQVGQAPSSFLVYKQVYNADGSPIQGLYEDLNSDGKITEADRYIFNRPAPDAFLGFTAGFRYSNFDVRAVFRGNIGNYVYNNVNSQLGTYRPLFDSFANLTNSTTDALNTRFENGEYLSDYYVENASFLKLDNVNIGYRLNNLFNDKVSARLYGTIQNVFVVTNYSGLDPEIAGGIDFNLYPRPRTFLLGLNLDF